MLFCYFYIFLIVFSSHFQVPPAELEHILHTNPEIADAAVVPYGSNPLILCVFRSRSIYKFKFAASFPILVPLAKSQRTKVSLLTLNCLLIYHWLL